VADSSLLVADLMPIMRATLLNMILFIIVLKALAERAAIVVVEDNNNNLLAPTPVHGEVIMIANKCSIIV
jgi:hypothetical protein